MEKDELKELGTPIDPERLVDFHIRTSWHVISRMYNQFAQKFGITMSMGFILLVIHEEHGTNKTQDRTD